MKTVIFLFFLFLTAETFADDSLREYALEVTSQAEFRIPVDFSVIIDSIFHALWSAYCSAYGFLITIWVILYAADSIFHIFGDTKKKKKKKKNPDPNSGSEMFSFSSFKSDDEIFESEGRRMRDVRKKRFREKMIDSGRDSLLYGDDDFE